ncbi:hypothetical protein MRB53_003305 [Persea americana]|uniref:Uncharacterized protein n=1 Tax=Persea americana TaxID=3435 RepID=A0ACC2MZB9_PERAE|nr:hypothetical protein MRB53_003305 [Persea americana]
MRQQGCDKVLLRVKGKRRDFSEARGKGFPLAPELPIATAQSGSIHGGIGLPLFSSGVVAYFLELLIRLRDRHQVRLEVTSGDVEQGLGEMDLLWGLLVVDGFAMGATAMVDGSG